MYPRYSGSCTPPYQPSDLSLVLHAMAENYEQKEFAQDHTVAASAGDTPTGGTTKRGAKFWLVFLSICLSCFLSALDITVVSTALPIIVHDLNGQDFVWIGAAYTLTSTAFLPMSGALAEIFGRRIAMISALIIFALGSALCGSAQSMNWLIAARSVQGLGGGAIVSLSSIVIADLVSLKERGAYNGLIGMTWAIATAIGASVGGSLATTGHWRWIFYLNLPVCGLALFVVLLFLKLPTPPGTLNEKLRKMDVIGNILIIGSTTSVVIALSWGGVKFSWSSPQVLPALIIGLVGTVVFFVYEATLASHPMVPFRILQNRTSISGYLQTFFNSLIILCVVYYLPVYYQSCKDASAIRSSVDMLGLTLTMGPFAILGGISVTASKAYRPQLWIAWVLVIAGLGAMTVVGADSQLALSIGLPVLMGIGFGLISATQYFPVLSALPVEENARALAFFTFCRFCAGVWGIAIGATVLQNELRHRLPSSFVSSLSSSSGVELSYSAIPLIPTLPEPLKEEVRVAFGESLKVLWKVLAGIAGVGGLVSLGMKGISLNTNVDERWGLEEGSSKEKIQGGGASSSDGSSQ